MVAATARRKTTFSGVRRLEGTRDLGGVAEVLAESFRGEMDAAGERAVREMRMVGRLGPLGWWLDLFMPIGEGFLPGFVWEEDGRIVGNASVRRSPMFGRGHIVGNVAVLPEYRGRGIARQLMEACIAQARDEDSEWMALEVHTDNAPARRLYNHLGFRQVGAAAQLRRGVNAPLPSPGSMPTRLQARRPRDSEQLALFSLAQSVTPAGLKWAEPLRESEFALGWDHRLDLWLAGRGESWRVAESNGQIVGAVLAETFRKPAEEGRLRVWVQPGHNCRTALMDAVFSVEDVRVRPLTVQHPAEDVEAIKILEQYGFQPVLTLAHMKLDLR